MNNFVIKPRPSDYVLGANSPLQFKAVNPSGVWTSRLEFFESQKLSFETNGCVLFTANEDLDAQMDLLIANGTISTDIVAQFRTMGYMDFGLDGQAHFHSSPRYTQIKTGNGYNGNSAPDPWDAIRLYGALPWLDLLYDASITQDVYLTGVTPAMDAKATHFLALMGGKNAFQYHWIFNDNQSNSLVLATALQQAPLMFGIATTDGWNQVTPQDPLASQTPNHCVMCYAINGKNSDILDHYFPFEKILDATYPVRFVLQAIVSPIITPITPPIPPAPTLPPNPTKPQINNWLTQLLVWLGIIKAEQNLTSNQMTNYSILKSRTFWTLVVAFAYNIWQLFEPTVAPQISGVLDVVFGFLTTYFHVSGVNSAAVASANAALPLSGQK